MLGCYQLASFIESKRQYQINRKDLQVFEAMVRSRFLLRYVSQASHSKMASFAIVSTPCEHNKDPTNLIASHKGGDTVREVWGEIHPELEKGCKVTCMGYSAGPGQIQTSTDGFEIDWATPLADLKELGIRTLKFKCCPTEVPEEAKQLPKGDAFSFMMTQSRKRSMPECKSRR